MIGIAIAVRHSMRRARVREYMSKRREAKRDSGADQGGGNRKEQG